MKSFTHEKLTILNDLIFLIIILKTLLNENFSYIILFHNVDYISFMMILKARREILQKSINLQNITANNTN